MTNKISFINDSDIFIDNDYASFLDNNMTNK